MITSLLMEVTDKNRNVPLIPNFRDPQLNVFFGQIPKMPVATHHCSIGKDWWWKKSERKDIVVLTNCC